MATMAELAERDTLTPSELKRFGSRVTLFDATDRKEDETFEQTKKRVFGKIEAFVKSTGGTLYTGMHKEFDWSKTFWWSKGGRLVNRTLEFVVIQN